MGQKTLHSSLCEKFTQKDFKDSIFFVVYPRETEDTQELEKLNMDISLKRLVIQFITNIKRIPNTDKIVYTSGKNSFEILTHT